MQIGNFKGRLVTFVEGSMIDVAEASGGKFVSDPQAVFDRWDEFVLWGRSIGAQGAGDLPTEDLGAPVPSPRQVFAIGVNYRAHAAEAGVDVPKSPMVFTKFQSCIVGPSESVNVVGETTDWEVELVVAIGKTAVGVKAEDAWSYVAGVTVGQDISDRKMQLAGPTPQFSLAKSHPGFGPIGPYLVTLDELEDKDDLSISCTLNGETVQAARTSMMVFSVSSIIEALSAVCTLFPGDIIFSGTPSGVGLGRKPPRYLRAGETLVSTIGGVGILTTHFVQGISISDERR
jgi:2-keto-4-pentenoate hydratase/2-oxohepta-3-ene-1,7-dioic acid hydratase in catechol pathway